MRLRANLASRLAFGLSGLWGLACSSPAYTQTLSTTPASSWSAANLPATPVYQDHYIGGGSLAPDISAGENGTERHARIGALAADRRRDEPAELA